MSFFAAAPLAVEDRREGGGQPSEFFTPQIERAQASIVSCLLFVDIDGQAFGVVKDQDAG
jgi:hypothetical protein